MIHRLFQNFLFLDFNVNSQVMVAYFNIVANPQHSLTEHTCLRQLGQITNFVILPLKELLRLTHDKFLWSILNSRKSILIKLLFVCVWVILSMQFDQFESSDVLSVSNTYTNSVTKYILSVSNA